MLYFSSHNRSTLTSSPPSWKWTTGPRSTVTPSLRTPTRRRRRRHGFQNLKNRHQSDSEVSFDDCPREIGTVVTSNKIQWLVFFEKLCFKNRGRWRLFTLVAYRLGHGVVIEGKEGVKYHPNWCYIRYEWSQIPWDTKVYMLRLAQDF